MPSSAGDRLPSPGVAALLAALLAAGCGASSLPAGEPAGSPPAETGFAETHLVDALPEAEADHASAVPLRVSWLELDRDRRRALVQHPPSSLRFTVANPPGSRLALAPAMSSDTWGTATDGVGFGVRCAGADGEWHELLALSLSPAERAEDRPWQPQEVALDACSAPETTLELSTTCGPANDCRWDLAAWGAPRVLSPRQLAPRVRRLALLVSIDTLRPDRTSVYGAERPTTPELEALAADGIVFETAIASAPWTIPSHASLLTSTDPSLHGATAERDIHPDARLLSEVLAAAGWSTAGFVDTPWLGGFGFDRGYDHYDAESPPAGSYRRGAAATRSRLLDWLFDAEGDAFVFWHVMDVHGPYGAAAPHGGRFRRHAAGDDGARLALLRDLAYHDYLRLRRYRSLPDLVAGYDEGIAAADDEVGRLLDVLRAAGLYEDALIVVTSDHGESLMDHGVWVGHGLFLTDDEIRVPLIVKLPGNRFAGTRVDEMVRLVDVAPTMLDVLDVPPPASFEGISLVKPRPGTRQALPRYAFGASSSLGARFVRSRDAKLITAWEVPAADVVAHHLRPQGPSPLTARLTGERALYDLAADPEERRNLAHSPERAAEAASLAALNDRYLVRLETLRRQMSGESGDAELDDEQVRSLRALGYLGGEGRR